MLPVLALLVLVSGVYPLVSHFNLTQRDSALEPEEGASREGQPALRVVQARADSSTVEVVEPVATEVSPPKVQCEAWAWALAQRRADGSLPSGQVLAEQFGRKPRWGRLVKQRGQQGLFEAVG